MKTAFYGQMGYGEHSAFADYYQFDICGKELADIQADFRPEIWDKPIILHGDWTKKGCSENNLASRLESYIAITHFLSERVSVIGFTIHPPSKSAYTLAEFESHLDAYTARTGVPVFVENRSNQKYHCSALEDIVSFSQRRLMTIDIPQLSIVCGYDMEQLIAFLPNIHWEHVREVHVANVKRVEPRTYVGRALGDGYLDMRRIFDYIQTEHVPFLTFEILGGKSGFERAVAWLGTEK